MVPNCILDIHWVWHVHMLAPVSYNKEFTKRFGKVINHKVWDLRSLELKRITTKKIWNKKYPSEPFDPANQIDETYNFESVFDYDIAEAVQRQKVFYYQVSLPHYRHSDFLAGAIRRYKMFLYLKSLYSDEFLVPCYDMDICWHTHQIQVIPDSKNF